MRTEFKLEEFETIIKDVLDSGGEFQMFPKGSSMLPLLREKIDSVVLVKPQGQLKTGDILLYKRSNGQYVLHRIVKVNQNSYELCGDNQIQIETKVSDTDIIGVVGYFYRREKKITDRNLIYKCYNFLWKSFILRRIAGKIRRMISGS